MPYFEVSGACPGCGETPYYKLVSQLFGRDMLDCQRNRMLHDLLLLDTVHAVCQRQER